MVKGIVVRFGLFVAPSLIVLPVHSSVKKLSSNRINPVAVAVVSGSPLPFPPPPGRSGSPFPFPPPLGRLA